MVRELSFVSDPVVLHIWSCLHNYAYGDALFAAERLYAETNSGESLYILATSLYKMGRPKQVTRLLNGSKKLSSKTRFLLAKCYYDIGLLTEAEDALLISPLSQNNLDDLAALYEDQACYVFLLLGDICRRQGRVADAKVHYKKCLDLNPLMWSAFKHLCNVGANMDPCSVFRITDNFSLTTPSYAVVVDELAQTAAHMEGDVKASCDKVSSRENVNPEKSYDIPTQGILAPSTFDSIQDKSYPPDIDNPFLHRTYITHCSKSFSLDLGEKTLPSELMQTPDCNIPPAVMPKAPRPLLQQTRKVTRNPFATEQNITDMHSESTPRFGVLALIPQSPMFACVPVFSKTTINPTSSDSVLSNSVRFGNNQSIPSRRATTNTTAMNQVEEIHPVAISTTRAHSTTSYLNSLSPASNRRNATIPDSDVNFTAVDSVSHNTSGNVVVADSRSNTRVLRNHTNPTTPTGALRRLVSAATSNLGFLTLENTGTSSRTASYLNSPVTRIEPPVLRSSVQRSLPSSAMNSNISDSPLPARSNLHLFNPNSPASGAHSSSTPRPFTNPPPSSVSRRNTELSSIMDSHNNGPRTRSQVAAAAAVARASGIQRRSNRLLRSRGHSRKLDTKQTSSCSSDVQTNLDKSNLQSYPLEMQESQSSDTPCDIQTDESICFGATPHYKAPLTNDTSSGKDDPRILSIKNYLDLLVQLGKAYQAVVRHLWRSATHLLSKIPASQLGTGRILAWAARAHMDNADYETARKLFVEARRLEPWQLCGMEFYSTVLWQLQADQDLSLLAHDLFELDRNAPEPWCAAGNCFSLQSEHEIAIKFFRKAIEVSPNNPYAWTLLGHEQSTLEEFDRALHAFQNALRIDPRHYNALFGLSNLYYKQEKFDLAEAYLNRAVTLFPRSHLLLTNLAALRSRLGRLSDGPGSARDLINQACKIQPNNPLARYHRASILFHLGSYQEALHELQRLLVLTPREAMVYLMIGHVYKKMGNTPQAMIHYSWAMELDPKGANTHLRDIMTNPSVMTRRVVQQQTQQQQQQQTVTNADIASTDGTPGRPAGPTTRSHLLSVPAATTSDQEDEDNEAMERLFVIEDDMLSGPLYPLHRTRSSIGPGVAASTTAAVVAGATITPASATHRLTDFSLLYDTQGFDDDEPALSDPDPEHYDTMDISSMDANGLDGESGTDGNDT